MPRVTALAFALATALAGACRPAPPETLARPAALPPGPDLAPVVELVTGPPPVRPQAAPIDDVVMQAARRLLPRPRIAVNPGRPSAGGAPLRLADLALRRGDPLDAAAQYRALLGDPRPEVATYVRWRLARAYFALGRPADAEPLLHAVASPGSPAGWAALLTLAEVVAARDGAARAMAQLRARAGGRADELEAWMIQIGTGDGLAELLVERAARVAPIDERCTCALTALAITPRVSRERVVRRCYAELAAGALDTAAPRTAALFATIALPDPQLAHLAEVDRAWLEVSRWGGTDRLRWQAWLALAHRYVEVLEPAPGTAAGERASWSAVAALDNAARLAVAHGAVTDELLPAAREILAAAHARHLARARAITDALRERAVL